MDNRAVIYVRESTREQDWESQLMECREYCRIKGFTILHEFMDQMSGARNDRKGFLELNDKIANKEFDYLVVWELSRTTRDFITYRTLLQEMRDSNIELHSLQEGILSTDEDIDKEFGIDIMALMNERERKVAGRRIKTRIKFHTENGLWKGGSLPIGYECGPDKILVPNKDAPMIKEIFELFFKGEAVPNIAKKFGFSDFRKLYRILKNPVYMGKLKLNETSILNKKKIYNKGYEIVLGKHEPIISEETFNFVNETLATGKRKTHSDNYLFKTVTCHCTGSMYPNKLKNGSVSYFCVKCHSGITSKNLEEMVFGILKSQLDMMEILKDVSLDPNNPQVKIKIYSHELSKLITQEEKLTGKYLEEKISETIFDKKIEEIKSRRFFLNREIDKLSKISQNKNMAIDNRGIFSNYIKKLESTTDVQKKKKILNLIISEVKMVNKFRGVIVSNLL
ncbi:MAG: recombinase family protein [Fusobacteriaceae bacterium]